MCGELDETKQRVRVGSRSSGRIDKIWPFELLWHLQMNAISSEDLRDLFKFQEASR